jgi:hypothetical protein
MKPVCMTLDQTDYEALKAAARLEAVRRGANISASSIVRELVRDFLALRERREATPSQRV